MNDIVLLEETIRTHLRAALQGLSAEILENYVVGGLGRRGDPVDITAYEAAINNLLNGNHLLKTEVTVEGYCIDEKEVKDGYKLRYSKPTQ